MAMQHPAVRALPGGYISRNDIVVAIAWLLGCDMHHRCRPGHAVAGTANVALLVLDLVENDLDGNLTRALVPPGALWLLKSTLHALLAWLSRLNSSLWHEMRHAPAHSQKAATLASGRDEACTAGVDDGLTSMCVQEPCRT